MSKDKSYRVSNIEAVSPVILLQPFLDETDIHRKVVFDNSRGHLFLKKTNINMKYFIHSSSKK